MCVFRWCGPNLSVEDEGPCNLEVVDGSSLSIRHFLDRYASHACALMCVSFLASMLARELTAAKVMLLCCFHSYAYSTPVVITGLTDNTVRLAFAVALHLCVCVFNFCTFFYI